MTVTNCDHLPAPQITVDYDKMCRYDRICREVRHNLLHATEYAVTTEYAGRFGIICRMRQIMPVRQIMSPQTSQYAPTDSVERARSSVEGSDIIHHTGSWSRYSRLNQMVGFFTKSFREASSERTRVQHQIELLQTDIIQALGVRLCEQLACHCRSWQSRAS